MFTYDSYISDNSQLCLCIEEININELTNLCEWKQLQLFENIFDVFMVKQNRPVFSKSFEIINTIVSNVHSASTPYISDVLCKIISKNVRS